MTYPALPGETLVVVPIPALCAETSAIALVSAHGRR